jgi:quinol monooxygenase YgiN
MAILLISTLPEMVTLDQALAVSKEIGAMEEVPVGCISHATIVDGGRVKIIDVWQSQEALDAFAQDRLMPAVMKVMGDNGMEGPPPPPDNQVFEAHDTYGATT